MMSVDDGVRLSIVMATYNCASEVGDAIDSLQQQSFENWELIIQDNRSEDGVAAKVAGLADRRIKFNSEADSGIYNAWNKAVRRCCGDWIMFLGADDRLSNPDVLAEMLSIAELCGQRVDLVSGQVQFYNAKTGAGRTYGEPWSWRRIKNMHCIAHPGALFRRDLWLKHGLFSEEYKIAGDYEFTVRLGKNVSACYVPKVIVLMGDEGVSSSNKVQSLFEASKVQFRAKSISKVRSICNLVLGCFLILARKFTKNFA